MTAPDEHAEHGNRRVLVDGPEPKFAVLCQCGEVLRCVRVDLTVSVDLAEEAAS